jgi:hypothetical protein
MGWRNAHQVSEMTMSNFPEMLILYPANSVDRLRTRIEALEAALKSIIALDHEDWEMDVKMREIARVALAKDTNK